MPALAPRPPSRRQGRCRRRQDRAAGRRRNGSDAASETRERRRAASLLRGLLDRVSPHADAFVTKGLPPNLLTRLGDEIETFATARATQSASPGRFSAASESILEALDNAARTADVLEAIVVNTPDAPPRDPDQAAPGAARRPARQRRAEGSAVHAGRSGGVASARARL